jgi:hypothetical protein
MAEPNHEDQLNPNLHNPQTGTTHGVPAGAATDEAKGVPDSGRHASETAPIAGKTPGGPQTEHG